jgi:3-methyladenine DNA glycosylase/8-oxoguanine DNA glycosylase
MTDEDITLLTKLQGFFKERMGNERNGDMFWSKQYNCISYVVEGSFSVDSDVSMDEEDIIVPLAINPINPERGLVEMLDRYHSLDYYFNNCWKLSCETKNGKPINVEAPDPYTALLKALCEQENIK